MISDKNHGNLKKNTQGNQGAFFLDFCSHLEVSWMQPYVFLHTKNSFISWHISFLGILWRNNVPKIPTIFWPSFAQLTLWQSFSLFISCYLHPGVRWSKFSAVGSWTINWAWNSVLFVCKSCSLELYCSP